MSRSRKKGAPFSLFAFQDAITSVCGVVVLITLLLAVQLTSRTIESELETEPDDSLAERAAELREEIAEAREALDAVPTPRISFDASKPYAGLSAVDLRAKVSELDARLESARAELERAKSELPREESGAPSEEESTKELAALREELKRAEEEASAAKKSAREPLDENVVLFSFPEEASETPWFVDISGTRIVATPAKKGEEIKRFEKTDEFLTWAKTRPNKREYFVLIVRPSGAGAYDEISAGLDAAGRKTGVDLVAETRELRFVPSAVREEGEP